MTASRRLEAGILLALACYGGIGHVRGGEGPAAELSVQDGGFLLDGSPVFLAGISMYGALGAPEEALRSDLDDLRSRGFNWIRVWATWGAFGNDVSAVDAEGRAREPWLGKLRRIVEECGRRGMVVDVTLSRQNGVTGPPRLQSLESHRRAVETIAAALRGHRNWYLDISNERNIRDKRFSSIQDLEVLRKAARRADAKLLVTASHAGDMSREDLRDYIQTVQVEFIAPHRPRDAGSPGRTEERTRELTAWMREIGRIVPVHYQEPFRRGFGKWQPKAEDYLADLEGARAGGAAGWCLHNGDQRDAWDGRPRRSFDLREKRLFDQLDPEERKAVEEISRVLGARRTPAGRK